MDEILQQEHDFQFQNFQHEDAFRFGMKVLEIVKREQLKNVRIRVTYQGNIVFQYLMNGKSKETWLDRKEKTVLESGHASLYVVYHQEDYEYMKDDPRYALYGGGFPLIENGEIKGVFCVSGLAHEDDHRLIIQALQEIQNKK